MKCKGKIVFSGELFKLDLQSEEKVNAAPNLLSEKVIDVIKFTKEEVLSGKSRDIDHIDYISLSLSSIPGYTFENSLSSGADFTISYDNISDFDTLVCKYENGCLHLTCDRIDEFIDEISDQNKIIPHNFKEVDIDTPTILISLNNKLISYIRFNADEWDEDAMSLSLFLVLDFTSAEDINTYFLTEHDNKYISCYFPDVDKIVFQSYNRGTYCDFMKGFFNPSNQKKPEYYTNYNGDLEMRKLYNKAKSILVK